MSLVPDQGEDDGDLDEPAAGFQAAVSSKDWTVETLVSQMRKGRINLDPSFQRRNAWLANRKSKLLESIMLGFPIPQIVLAEEKDSPGRYIVLDGKQRLLALRQFFVESDDERDREFEALKLTGLEVLPELNGFDLDALRKERDDLVGLTENHSIRTVVLSKWNSERLLLSLFLRLNTGSVALSPQELRQALIHGDFMTWLDHVSGDSLPMRELLNNTHPDRRMVDAELLLRHFAFVGSPLRYAGNLKAFLDDTSRYFNDNWDAQQQIVQRYLTDFESALTVGIQTMGAEAFARKWTPAQGEKKGRFERALNRAVFDFQVYSLNFEAVRDSFADNADEVVDAFKTACSSDETFVRSISATTKTADAFIVRHKKWQAIIHQVTGIAYPLPAPLERD
ncbi:hypothetical protein B1790_31585 [Mycobacterium sp. AT1]|nr:hypothetical protein B1790_31585 [Mycobacterium sp. AT1]